jgi:ElaA protein
MIQFKAYTFSELNTELLYQIISLRLEVFIMEQNCLYQDCDGKDLQALHLLGFEENQLVAYCRILPEGISYTGYCSIGRVLTKSTHRGKQYGIALMEKAISICTMEFKFPLKISAQAYLEKFYTNLGFKTVGELYLEDHIPHIGMIYKHQTT